MNRAVPVPQPRPWDWEVFPTSRLYVACCSSVRATSIRVHRPHRVCLLVAAFAYVGSDQVLRRNRDVLTFYINRLACVSRLFPSPVAAVRQLALQAQACTVLFLSAHSPVCHKCERPVLTREPRLLHVSVPYQLIFQLTQVIG